MFAKQFELFNTYSPRRQFRTVLGLLWTIIFLLYLPAARAGFVVDFTGWLDSVKNQSFLDYINRTHFNTKSLFHFTQLASWSFYKLFGTCAWAWHLLFVTMAALNATLLFRLLQHLATASGIAKSTSIALISAVFVCICPLVSEVIVWEPSFHYLLGLLLILSILHLIRRFIETGNSKYRNYAVAVYILSLFSLEYFYATPFLVLSYTLYLRYGLRYTDRSRQEMLYIVVPLFVLATARTFLFHALYNDWVSRAGQDSFTRGGFMYWILPLKYFFHIVLLGRFWEPGLRDAAYSFLNSPKTVYLFFTLLAIFIVVYLRQFGRLGPKLRLAGLLVLWTGFGIVMASPLWFPEFALIQMDRYAYLALVFCLPLLVLLLSMLPRYITVTVLVLYALVNTGLTLKVNRYWYLSDRIIHDMLHEVPDPGNKIVILLNIPEHFNGAPMVQACTHGEFRLMHDLLFPEKKLKSTIYEMASYNMTSYWDGASVIMVNDSLVKVTLAQWGTWWWRDGKGGVSHETADYKLDMRDQGHWYELTLKRPKRDYILLYMIDGHLKPVNLDWIGGEQF